MTTPAVAPIVAHHWVAIAGRVTDALTQKAIAGAEVTIVQMPGAFRQKLQHRPASAKLSKTQTRSDGVYYFLDLPQGAYTLEASFPASGKRYGRAQENAEVPNDPTAEAKLKFVNLALQPTTVKGRITDGGQKGGVMLARVQIKGSGERVFSNQNGEYTLSGIEPGQRTLQVFAQGFQLAAERVQVVPGKARTQNFELLKESG